MTNGNRVYDFGKWVETEVIPILGEKFGFEIVQTKDKFCDIDAMIYRKTNFHVYPCQIKAYSARAKYQDISIKQTTFDKYKKIAEHNNGYKVFQINTIYNPHFGLDYGIYAFDINDIPTEVRRLSQYDPTSHVYMKYSDMMYFDCLPIEFQKDMERLKYELNPPSEQYAHFYHKKFDG